LHAKIEVATFSKLQPLIRKRRYLFEKDAEDLKKKLKFQNIS